MRFVDDVEWAPTMAGITFRFREKMHDELAAMGVRWTPDVRAMGEAVIRAMVDATLLEFAIR